MSQYEFKGLDKLEKNLAKMIAYKYPKEFEAMVIQLAYELQGSVKELTPVDTSRLRDAWRVGKIKKIAKDYVIEVTNNVEYSEAVEYGHRTGAKGYKDGVFMLEISLAKLKSRLNPYLKRWIAGFIKNNEL